VGENQWEEALQAYMAITSSVPNSVEARLSAEAIPEIALNLAKQKVEKQWAWEEAAELLQSVAAPSISPELRIPAIDLLIELSRNLESPQLPLTILQARFSQQFRDIIEILDQSKGNNIVDGVLLRRLLRKSLLFPQSPTYLFSSDGHTEKMRANVEGTAEILRELLLTCQTDHSKREVALMLCDTLRLAGNQEELKMAFSLIEPSIELLEEPIDWCFAPLGGATSTNQLACSAWVSREVHRSQEHPAQLVEGVITLDGEPLPSALILFEPVPVGDIPEEAPRPALAQNLAYGFLDPAGAVAGAMTNSDGTFSVRFLPEDHYRTHILLLGKEADQPWPLAVQWQRTAPWTTSLTGEAILHVGREPVQIPEIQVISIPRIQINAPVDDSVVSGASPSFQWSMEFPPGFTLPQNQLSFKIVLRPEPFSISGRTDHPPIEVYTVQNSMHYPPIQSTLTREYPPLVQGVTYRVHIELLFEEEPIPAECESTVFTLMPPDFPQSSPSVNRTARRLAAKTRNPFHHEAEEFQVSLEDFLKKHPQTVHRDALLLSLGRCLAEQGRTEQARDVFQEASAFNPKSPLAQEAALALKKLDETPGN
jgi:hypothetical protein